MEDRGPELLGAGIAFIVLTLFTFSLRIYVRGFILRTWGMDDWLITGAVASFTAYFVCQTAGIVYGTGRHLKDLEPNRAKTALIYWWLCELFYIPSAIFLKLSVGVFLHRIAINKWHIWIVRLMMIFSGLFGTVYLLLAIFQCKPISAWWIKKHSPLEKEYGWCFTNDVVVGVTFASSALNSIADWTFGILPFFIVKDLHMAPRSKKLVACILAFANIACVATIVRMPFILDLYRDDDFLFETIEIALWSNVEAGIGITAACIATLRPLMRKTLGRRASAWFPERNQAPTKYYPDVHDATSSGGKSYALERSASLRPASHYVEISAGSRRGRSRERKDMMITGKEIRELYEEVDEEGEQELRLSSAAQAPACASPGIARAHTPTLEIRKSIEFTFTIEEAPEESRPQRPEISRSTTPTNWPIVAPPVVTSNGRSSPLPAIELAVDDSPSSPESVTFPSPPRQLRSRPPADVGDPFGAWRALRGD